MNLYLVRHGEPMSGKKDLKRPLSKRGISEIRMMAAFLTRRGVLRVKQIFHSSKLRARQTAETLAEKINPPNGVMEAEGLQPMDDPSAWAYRLAQTEDDTMLVGHLPFMARLASLLLCGKTDELAVDFPTGRAVCLKRDRSGSWSLQWAISPSLLR